MKKDAKIYVAGHRGLVGQALCRALRERGCLNLCLRASEELDLRAQNATDRFFLEERPEYVFLAAAKVGGILANTALPADFIRDNLLIQANVIDAAFRSGVRKLMFLGSSCIYPKMAEQPIREASLLTGPLEPTNEPYAIAKIAGIRMCQAYSSQYGFNAISLMPTNLYGPFDNFDPVNSHAVAALMQRFHNAVLAGDPDVSVWGTGTPKREFLHVDDFAAAALFLMEAYDSPELINVGSGTEISIRELARLMASITGFSGKITYDRSKPDGTPRKLMDSSKLLALGWQPRLTLAEGLAQTYAWFKVHGKQQLK